MRVIAFRHVPFGRVGRLGPALATRGLSLEYADLYDPQAKVPEVADAAGLIFLGGPMSVNDPCPTSGAGRNDRSGGGARSAGLGHLPGSAVDRSHAGKPGVSESRKEIGWFDIHLTEEARKDRVFAG